VVKYHGLAHRYLAARGFLMRPQLNSGTLGRPVVGFLRFVVTDLDPDSGRRQGVLQAAFSLRDRGELSADERATLSAIGVWLDAHLPKPARLSRKRNNSHRTPMAISWFKDSARQHVAKVREVAALLEARGIRVETIATDRPGYIVYEDDFQVAAEPFADTGA
jgi:hypothetical protein